MALAQYTDTFWFPNGSPAVNVSTVVFPRGSSIPATLYTDVTGTTQLANPMTTSGTGVLSFWAEAGEYWVHLDTESFRVSVGAPDALNTHEAGSVAVSTGVIAGGNVSIASPTTITITEFVGYVVDYATDPFRPVTTRVRQATQTVALVGASLTRTVTWWLVDSAGTLIQQGTPPTNTQRRTHIVLAATAFDVPTLTLFELVAIPQILPQPMNQALDFIAAVGPFNVSGNTVSANGANLQINSSAGTLFQPAWAYNTTPNDPHTVPTAAGVPVQFRYGLQNTTAFPPLTTLVDAANYDNGGVLTPVGGGANRATVHRVFKFASVLPSSQTTIQYGQAVYPTLAAAAAAVGSTDFVVNPQFTIGALVAYIAVTHTATDLSDPAQATFIRPITRFPIP